ncbi:hypothetical protein FKM82_024445 [Ascaphus truei]
MPFSSVSPSTPLTSPKRCSQYMPQSPLLCRSHPSPHPTPLAAHPTTLPLQIPGLQISPWSCSSLPFGTPLSLHSFPSSSLHPPPPPDHLLILILCLTHPLPQEQALPPHPICPLQSKG